MTGLKEKHFKLRVVFILNTFVKGMFSVPQSFTLVCIVGTIGYVMALCFNVYNKVTR